MSAGARRAATILVFCTGVTLATATEAAGQSHVMRAGHAGIVEYSVRCAGSAPDSFAHGLALLHHMTYEAAADAFRAAARADSGCAMAYWGEAMTYIHPLWSDPPSEAAFERGRMLAARAEHLAAADPLESAFAAAVGAYYAAGRSEAEGPNLEAFDRGWAKVHQRFPDQVEAAAFFALAHLGTADPADKSYEHQRTAGALMEAVLSRHPDHPGAHHYLIHAYDYPPLAQGGLAVARDYGNVAPDVAHALHMPTHTFTRLGQWDEAISWNLRSAAAARAAAGEATSLHYLHALDYLVYAWLQTGRQGRAEEVQATLQRLDGPIQVELASAYTLAAVPARIALELRRWKDAAALVPREPSTFPWDRFPAVEALTHYARALGGAHLGDTALVQQSIARLERLRATASRSSDYWANQIAIQVLVAKAALAAASGDSAEALTLFRQGADAEAATEKHPVTPGELLPAGELLGEFLLDVGQPAPALAQFTRVLERSPNRLNSLRGAARAAQLSGDLAGAARYRAGVAKLLAETAPGGTGAAKVRQP